jgi:UDP-N-acetylglucosamine 2-epimerase (non-hydrolysing)
VLFRSVRALVRHDVEVRAVATGQHASPEMTDVLFRELDFWPDVRWELDGDEAARTGTMLKRAMRETAAYKPDLVMVLGDTYTVPLFSLAARRDGVPVAHVEAGLRSFNERSLEEVHRRIATAMVSLHLAPTELAAHFLAGEGVGADRIQVVGNPIVDVLRTSGVERTPPSERSGVLFTAHRATNVDDPARLAVIVDLVCRLAEVIGPVTFPVHPRTQARLDESGLVERLMRPDVELSRPLGYRAILSALSGCRVLVTDSGGLQEEASWFGIPTVILRNTTARWEGLVARVATLTGVHLERAVEAALRFNDEDEQARVASVPSLYGDGHTAARVARLVADPDLMAQVQLREPDWATSAPV